MCALSCCDTIDDGLEGRLPAPVGLAWSARRRAGDLDLALSSTRTDRKASSADRRRTTRPPGGCQPLEHAAVTDHAPNIGTWLAPRIRGRTASAGETADRSASRRHVSPTPFQLKAGIPSHHVGSRNLWLQALMGHRSLQRLIRNPRFPPSHPPMDHRKAIEPSELFDSDTQTNLDLLSEWLCSARWPTESIRPSNN